jgi:hypothetical protein
MAFDQFGNVVPDGTPGSSAMPPVAAPTPATPTSGSYYTGDPGNPLTSDPNAAFGSRTISPGTNNLMQLNPAALGQGGVPGAAPTPGVPGVTGGPPATNMGSSTGFGTSPTAGQFGPGASVFDPFDPTHLSIAYSNAHGIGPYRGQQAVVADRASNLPLVYMLLNGNASLNPQNYTDWADQYMSQSGGQGMSTADFMNGAFSNDTTNPVFNMLHLKKNADGTSTALSASEQVQAFSQVMQSGLAQTVPPMVLNAMLSMYGQAGNEYIAATQSGQFNGSYTDFLQQRGLGPGVLGG